MENCAERVAPPKRFAKDIHSKRLSVVVNEFIQEKSK